MVSVNKDLCIGCGSCVALCPQVFQIGADGKSEVISDKDDACAQNAAASCPVQAILVV